MIDTRTMAAFSLLLTLGLGCAADIGEACDKSGSTSDCVDEAICTIVPDGSKLCLERCSDDAQCAATEACNGVSGSNIKSCQPK